MATLNLHLDFMEDHKPIHFKELSSEEELQITQDSIKLLEQINDDLRVLDKMCSALENLFIIKEHYEQYGTSPALEALVGDIKQYLGISMEAEENKADDKQEDKEDDTSTDKKKGGGVGGAIKKIIDWICNIFKRMGEWLGLCEKKADSDYNDVINAEVDNNKVYQSVPVMSLVYKEGQVKSGREEVTSAINGMKQALDRSAKVSTISGTTYEGMYDSFQKMLENSKTDAADVKGSNIKPLAKATYETFKGVRKEVPVLRKASEHLKDSWDGKIYNPINGKAKVVDVKEIKRDSNSEAYFVRMTRLGISSLQKTAHSAAICLSGCRKVLHGDGTQKGKIQTDNEQKAAEEKKKQEENKQPEQKTEEKK